jgi:hypothetical protein
LKRSGPAFRAAQLEFAMEENTFWLRIWQTVAAALVALAMTVAGCSSYRSSTIERMVNGGADPIKSSCAVNSGGDVGIVVLCMAAAGK